MYVEARQQRGLFGGYVGSQGGNSVAETGLVQRDDVHVPLDHQALTGSANGTLGKVEPVEQFGFLEQLRLRSVQVLWQTIVENPSREAHYATEVILDRKYDPIAKPVVASARAILGQQAGIEEIVLA